MTIREDLELGDKVSGPAGKMADSVGKLAGAAKKAQDGLNKMSGKTPSSSKKPVQEKKQQLGLLSQEEKLERRQESAAKWRVGELQDVGKLAKLDAGELAGIGLPPALALGVAGVAVGLVKLGEAALSAAKAVVELGIQFGEMLIAEHEARDNAVALLNTLSSGRGEELFGKLQQQALATGQNIQDLEKNLAAARKAGLSFTDSFKLNNLRGDIIATGHTAEEADKAIGDMLDEVKKGKSASAAMAELAGNMHAAGDGTQAAAKQMKTLSGAISVTKQLGSAIMSKLAKDAGPALDRIGEKVTSMIGEFVKSGKAKQMVDMLSAAIQKVLGWVEKGLSLVGPFWEGFKAGIKPVMPLLEAFGQALGKMFEGDTAGKMQTLQKVAAGLGAVLAACAIAAGVLAIAVGILAAPFIGAAVAIGLISFKLGELAVSAGKAGADLVTGLINGIKDGIGRAVQAAQELANKVKATIASVFDSHSPSKVGHALGFSIPQGLAQGQDAGHSLVANSSQSLGAKAVSKVGAGMQGAAGSNAGGARGGATVTINVYAGGDARAQWDAIKPEIQAWFEGRALESAA